jgi:restriction system protein
VSRLRAGGGYRDLRSFKVTTLIYDGTVAFCERFVHRRSRLTDQMVQAARSGRQNIAEGSRASIASSQTELRLMSVARASLDELLLDYEDRLRQRGLRLWGKDDPEAREVRGVGFQTQASDAEQHFAVGPYAKWLTADDPSIRANALICLIHQANYLLDRQIAVLEQQFVNEGGYTERLATARLQARQNQRASEDVARDPTDPSDLTDLPAKPPACPLCAAPLVVRTAHRGEVAGTQFWGCSRYPDCRGSRKL